MLLPIAELLLAVVFGVVLGAIGLRYLSRRFSAVAVWRLRMALASDSAGQGRRGDPKSGLAVEFRVPLEDAAELAINIRHMLVACGYWTPEAARVMAANKAPDEVEEPEQEDETNERD